MRVLFLDIDGVVNNHRTPQTDGWPIDQFCAFQVGRIKEHTGCEVVLSSSWRHSAEGVEVVKKKVVPLFDLTSLGEEGVIGRGSLIKRWLDAHPEVTRYAILDDNRDMLDEQFPNFFQTYFFCCGLTEEIADKVIGHLNKAN